MKKIFLLTIALAFALVVMAQERVVTGVVMDGELEGEPLIGATVSIGDGKVGKGTVTDYNGRFSLKVPAGTKKLTVSYVGYESRVINLTATNSDYSVQLPADSRSLSEVVVGGCREEYRPGAGRSDSWSVNGVCQWCSRCSCQDTHPWYRLYQWRTGTAMGARWYTHGR